MGISIDASHASDLARVQSNVLALVQSYHPHKMYLHYLQSNYRYFHGQSLDFKALGFHTLKSLVCSIEELTLHDDTGLIVPTHGFVSSPVTPLGRTNFMIIELLSKYHQGVRLGILTALYQYHHQETLEYKPKKLTEFLNDMDDIVIRSGRAHLTLEACLTPRSAVSLDTLKANVVELLCDKSRGIRLRNLVTVYERTYQQRLEHEHFGFPSLADLVESIPNVYIARKSNQKKYALVSLRKEGGTVVAQHEKMGTANDDAKLIITEPTVVDHVLPSLAAATFSFDENETEEELTEKEMDAIASPSNIKPASTTPNSVYRKEGASPQHVCFNNVFGWFAGKPNHRKLLMSP